MFSLIYDRKDDIFGVFLEKEDEKDNFQLLKIVYNTKQIKEIIRKYKTLEKDYLYGTFFN